MSIQNGPKRQKFSRLRQELVALADEARRLIQPFLADSPVIAGSLYELKRKCGKERCRCASGSLHARMVVSSKVGGKTKLRVVARGRLVEVRVRVRTYKELRVARARLGHVFSEMVEHMDALDALRRMEVP